MNISLLPPGPLLPKSNESLLPPSTVLPPIMAAGVHPVSSAEDIEGLAEQAKSLMEKTNNRTAELIAQHGPTLKQAAQKFSTSATEYAKKSAHTVVGAGRQQQEKLIKKTKERQMKNLPLKIGASVACFVVLLCAVIWGVASQRATTIANAQISDFITNNGLSQYVTYRSISASPFGNVEIDGLNISVGDGPSIKIAAVNISNITKIDGQIAGGAIALHGFDLPLLKITRKSILSGLRDNDESSFIIADLATLGYPDLKGNLNLSVQPLSNNQYQLKTTGVLNNLGGLSANLIFGNIPNDLVSSLQNQSSALDAFVHLANTTLVSSKLTINNSGIRARAISLTSQASPWDSQVGLVYQLDKNKMIQDGLTLHQANKIQNTFNLWLKNGGTLTVTSNLEQPLHVLPGPTVDNASALSTLLGGGSNSTINTGISSIEDFLALTKAQLSF